MEPRCKVSGLTVQVPGMVISSGLAIVSKPICKLSVKVHISRNIHVYFKTKVRTTGFLLNLFNLTPPSLSMRNLILSDSWYDEITYLFYPLILNSFRIIAPIPPSAFVCVYFLLSLDQGYVVKKVLFQCHFSYIVMPPFNTYLNSFATYFCFQE